jgi:hypothetical protein
MKVRLETMTKCHCLVFLIVLVALIIVVFGASFKTSFMLIYNTGDSFMCSTDKVDNYTDTAREALCLET